MSTWWGHCTNMQEIWFPPRLFEGRPRGGKKVLPDGLDWHSYIAGTVQVGDRKLVGQSKIVQYYQIVHYLSRFMNWIGHCKMVHYLKVFTITKFDSGFKIAGFEFLAYFSNSPHQLYMKNFWQMSVGNTFCGIPPLHKHNVFPDPMTWLTKGLQKWPQMLTPWEKSREPCLNYF